MTSCVGLDINGFHDKALEASDSKSKQKPERICGGVAAVVASHEPDPLVVGPEAHWSTGAKTSVARILDAPDDSGNSEFLTALFARLGNMRDVGVLAISDTGPENSEGSESAQEIYLRTLRKAGIRKRQLVWRPVLAVLNAIDSKNFPEQARNVWVLSHHRKGIAFQHLQLISCKEGGREPGTNRCRKCPESGPCYNGEGILLPARAAPGKLHSSELGLEHIQESLFRLFLEHNDAQLRDRAEFCDSLKVKAAELVVGIKSADQPVLMQKGRWLPWKCPSKAQLSTLLSQGKGDFPELEKNCSHILFETPATGVVREHLHLRLQAAYPDYEIIMLSEDSVVSGALLATKRLEDGIPTHLDSLPPIQTIADSNSSEEEGKRVEVDLVTKKWVLPNEEYRSENPMAFKAQQGQRAIVIYLRKTGVGDDQPRKEEITITDSSAKDEEGVQFYVQQAPLTGRAKLILSSKVFPGGFKTLNWDKLAKADGSWQDILSGKSLHSKPLDAIVLEASMDLWHGYKGKGLLFQQVDEMAAHPEMAPDFSWRELANQLSLRQDGKYPISSRGEFPEELPSSYAVKIDQLLEFAVQDVKKRGSKAPSLRFATWTGWRCPEEIRRFLCERIQSGKRFAPLFQGAGRTMHEPEEYRVVLQHLCSLPEPEWKRDQLACAAYILSRTVEESKSAQHAVLPYVDSLAQDIIAKKLAWERQNQEYTSTFIYIPFFMVGLLRLRAIRPGILLADRDESAERILTPLKQVYEDVKRKAQHEDRLAKYVKPLKDSVEALQKDVPLSQLLKVLDEAT